MASSRRTATAWRIATSRTPSKKIASGTLTVQDAATWSSSLRRVSTSIAIVLYRKRLR